MKTLVDDKGLEHVVEDEAGLEAQRTVHAGQRLVDSLATPVSETAPVQRATPALILSVVCATVFSAALVFYVLLPTIKTLVSSVPGSFDPAP